MKIEEIRKITKEDINVKIFYFRKELFNLKLELELAKNKNTSRLRKIRKIIARMKTVLREKEIKENFLTKKK